MVRSTLLPKRYSLANLNKAIRNPRLLHRELYTLAVNVNGRFHETNRALRGEDGIDVMAADWDTLVILDACRYDMFAGAAVPTLDLDGRLTCVQSKGSDSWEFMEANFAGRQLHDTVYVTANPHLHKLPEGTFHAVVDLLETSWDDDARTVHPADAVEEALSARDVYPDKRLIVHLMQPHFPFLGPTGERFEHSGIELHLDDDRMSGAPNPWIGLLSEPKIDPADVIEAYRENLELALPHVERLVKSLDGKTVVTADHGNLVGERGFPVPVRMYGHPRGLPRSELLAVPWFEVERGERIPTVAERPAERETGDERMADAQVTDRLQALGYR